MDVKDKKKKYLKLRKNHNLLSILLFLAIVSLLYGAMVVLCHVFGFFILNTAIEMEYKNIRNTVSYYESTYEDTDEPFRIFDMSCGSYYIIDDNGSVIAMQGEDTRSDEFGYLAISDKESVEYSAQEDMIADDRVKIYTDKDIRVINVANGDLSVSFEALIDLVNDSGMTYDKVLFSEEKVALVRLHIPAWIELSMKNGSQTLYYKADISISPSSLIMLFTIFTLTGVVTGIIVIGLLIYSIVGILNQRKFDKLFFYDMKTGGHNWLWFWLFAEYGMRIPGTAEKRFAVVDLKFMDYRHFCVCHSVDEGDRLRRKIYDILGSKLEKKEMYAVSAEDRFVMLLEYEDETALKERLEALIAALDTVDETHDFAFHIGVSLMEKEENGGILKRRKEADIEGQYNMACAACLSIEQSEGDAIAFYDEKLIEEQKWIDTVNELQQKALDNEEFVVYYQPKYNPKTNELRGAEALIRWQSPEYGFLSPGRFIPVFEKNGFITKIDHYMITHVARDQKKWLDKGLNCVPISVNVSRAHFIESDLAEQIRDMVDEEGLPHELIEIELTESAFFDDKKAMIETIHKLKEYGFMVSMDDFGAGYSSLNSLKDMPLDVLKLDADFFRGAAEDKERAENVVSEAIKMAGLLGMHTVAEGVEHKEQVVFLAEHGCDMIQGYFYAKPMPGDDYVQRMIQRFNEGEEQE